jgi:hypothetical protein
MTRFSVLLGCVACALLPAAALAAVTPGSYKGTSSQNELYRYGDVDPYTDKGKVTFSVKGSAVLNFKLAGQEVMCGNQPVEIPVKVAKMKLGSTGRGKGTYTNPNVGPFKVAIKVTSSGRASGTVTPTGLCRGVVKFSAKRG